jgi:hypothetical protein
MTIHVDSRRGIAIFRKELFYARQNIFRASKPINLPDSIIFRRNYEDIMRWSLFPGTSLTLKPSKVVALL